MTKVCKNCGETKPVEEFYANQFSRDGLRGDCKKCKNRKQYESRLERRAKWNITHIQDDLHWSTKDEVAFLRGIGTYSNCGSSKREILLKYLRSMHLRDNWDWCNPEVVKLEALKLLTQT